MQPTIPKNFASKLEYLLRQKDKPSTGIEVIDMFCGCGGLSLGLEAAGLSVSGFDANADAVNTSRINLAGKTTLCHINYDFNCPAADVIVGGPPCQPFSVLGSSLGRKDRRDGFPAFIEAVRQVRPKLWMFENVTGLLREKSYLEEILRSLRRLGYTLDHRIMNASEHGVPQNRKRLVVVGYRNGIFEWPASQIRMTTVQDAIGRLMRHAPKGARLLTRSMHAYIQRYEQASKCLQPRDLVPDKPARTVTCRNLAGATGDMLRVRLPDGRRRMLTVREAARLQSFPDSYKFVGSTSSIMNQIGNAVPPLLALSLGAAIRKCLE